MPQNDALIFLTYFISVTEYTDDGNGMLDIFNPLKDAEVGSHTIVHKREVQPCFPKNFLIYILEKSMGGTVFFKGFPYSNRSTPIQHISRNTFEGIMGWFFEDIK